VIALNEHHLKRLMRDYIRYYHDDRTHLGLAKETPANRQAEMNNSGSCSAVSLPRLGGLHHRYQLAA
jgi:putative transposase